MIRKALAAIVALAIVITGAIIGLRFAGDDPVKGKVASQVTASSHAEEDHYGRKAKQGQTALAQEERKLAEGRRQAERGQHREAEELGMILALRHEEERTLAEAPRQVETERHRHQADQQQSVVEQQAQQELRLAEGRRQVEQQVAQAEERKLADARRQHAPDNAHPKKGRLTKCTASCKAKVSKRRGGTAVRQAAYRGGAPHARTGYFICPFFERLHVALAELTTPGAGVAVDQRSGRRHYRQAHAVQ